MHSPGARFRAALKEEFPLQIVGVVNAYAALLAERAGFRALYLSGAGVANVSYGLPDLGMTTLDNVLTDVRRILERVQLPLLVDIDTGWGGQLMIERTIALMEQAGVAGVHIEDQKLEKRCGHRPGKQLVSAELMCRRIEAAVRAKKDPAFVIMARCDAFAEEGKEGLISRCQRYHEAGADMLFAEALPNLDLYHELKEAVPLPLLANLTEFGRTPQASLEAWREAGVDMVLYPLSAVRAMHQAADKVYREIRAKGTQETCLPLMQTRDELYEVLDYYKFEREHA